MNYGFTGSIQDDARPGSAGAVPERPGGRGRRDRSERHRLVHVGAQGGLPPHRREGGLRTTSNCSPEDRCSPENRPRTAGRPPSSRGLLARPIFWRHARAVACHPAPRPGVSLLGHTPARVPPTALGRSPLRPEWPAALVYQVAWQRILALHSGVGLYSVTMIVAAFLAGLGLGSHVGGVPAGASAGGRAACLRVARVGHRASAARPSPLVTTTGCIRSPRRCPARRGREALLHFAALLPPTALMGMSLPFLVRADRRRCRGRRAPVGMLYGCNLLGAASARLSAPGC